MKVFHRREKYFTKSFDAGKKEHQWEFFTTLTLLFGVITAIVYYKYYSLSWMEATLSSWLVLALIVHIVARYYHRKEKKFNKKAHSYDKK